MIRRSNAKMEKRNKKRNEKRNTIKWMLNVPLYCFIVLKKKVRTHFLFIFLIRKKMRDI